MRNIPLSEYIRVQALDDLGTQEFINIIGEMSNNIINNPIKQDRMVDLTYPSVFSVQAMMNIYVEVLELIQLAINDKDNCKEILDDTQTEIEDGSLIRKHKNINTDYIDKTLFDIENPINGYIYVVSLDNSSGMYLRYNDEWIYLGNAPTNDLWHKKEIDKMRQIMYEKFITTIPDNDINILAQDTFNSVIE